MPGSLVSWSGLWLVGWEWDLVNWFIVWFFWVINILIDWFWYINRSIDRSTYWFWFIDQLIPRLIGQSIHGLIDGLINCLIVWLSRLARKKKFNLQEEKRIQQDIELQTYINRNINTINHLNNEMWQNSRTRVPSPPPLLLFFYNVILPQQEYFTF